MSALTAPFLASDDGDVSVYETIDKMVASIESIDALDESSEYFDSQGVVLIPQLDETRWHLTPSSSAPQPQRLETILRSYFARLPNRYAEYTARATSAASLSSLVDLRVELAQGRGRRLGTRGIRRA